MHKFLGLMILIKGTKLDYKNKQKNKKIIEKALEAHKGILSVRSPVFNRMLSSDNEVKESSEGEVRIKDIQYNIFKELIYYLYCGKITAFSVFKTIELNLWKAADIYEVRDLCEECDLQLSKSITLIMFMNYWNGQKLLNQNQDMHVSSVLNL